MRSLALAALTMVTALGAGEAQAQRLGNAGAPYPMPPGDVRPPYPNQGYPNQGYPNQAYPNQAYPNQPRPNRPNQGPRQGGRNVQQRWARDAGGHWIGGSDAPGGWNAYRRPTRGYRLPHYWTDASFFIGDYAGYGLAAPPPGYGWHRYYDDAVLTDGRGRVYDTVDGIDWDGGYGGEGGYAESSYDESGYAYAEGGRGGRGYAPPPPVQNGTVTTYTTGGGYPAGGYMRGGLYYPPASTTVVTIQGAPATTTTTTTEYVEETRTRYVHRAPVRHYYRPAPTCGCKVVRPVRRHVWHRPAEPVIQGS